MIVLNDKLNDLIRSRRTVKAADMKKGGSVSREIIEEALQNAVFAPNHGRTEPWHFVVFSGVSLKKLNEVQAGLYKELSGEKFMKSKYERMLLQHETVCYSIAICLRPGANPNIPEWEEIAALGCAVQNMALTIANYGLGGMWASGNFNDNPQIRNFIGMNESDRLLGYFLVGEILNPPANREHRPLENAVDFRN